jgi:hypothetical protein
MLGTCDCKSAIIVEASLQSRICRPNTRTRIARLTLDSMGQTTLLL